MIAMSGALVTLPSRAGAAPIDNPGDAVFVFYNNPNAPFLEFPNADEISCHDPGGPGSEFEANVNGSGVMSYTSHSMRYHVTSFAFGGFNVYAQLDIDDLTGRTDLSGADPDVDWTITARLRFRHGNVAQGDFGESECSTDYFEIDVDGDWGDTVSDDFTIPALDGSSSQNCDGGYFIINFLFDLGDPGAKLYLYKFEAYNLSTMNPLTGS